ncbi:hypothetical protein AUJ17_05150 [Candidatus Micrarchaeota archaeon CG1_02_47_40]|nr:MAG: hypothetical protein AUJ17_05150 [Candidatus Micrarchaeota archaeon CG1_02_47_40]
MGKIRTAIVIWNPKKKSAKAIGSAVEKFLQKKGVKIIKGRKADLLVAVSGDGTILYNKNKYSAIIFGIGSKKSFVCQANERDWKGKLERLLAKPRFEKRMLLSSLLDGRKLPDALNEVVVRNRAHRILELKLFVGKRKFAFRADGIMFSTPTGSSAYAYSCGGRELGKQEKKYEIVAIAPFRRAFSPLIVPQSTKCLLKIVSECDAHAVIDGQFAYRLKRKSKVKVWRSGREVLLARA